MLDYSKISGDRPRVNNLNVTTTHPLGLVVEQKQKGTTMSEQKERKLGEVELMQKLMQLFNSGGRGSYPTFYNAQKAVVVFRELLRESSKASHRD